MASNSRAAVSRSALFILKNGDKHGPFDEQMISRLLREGAIKHNDYVWQEGMEKWQPLHSVVSIPNPAARVPPRPRVVVDSRPNREVQNPKGSPIHILAALITMVLDMLWSAPKVLLSLSGIGVPVLVVCSLLVGLICCIGVTLVQHNLVGEEWNIAFTKGFSLAILAGVPFPFLGTAAGVLFLGWAGIRGVKRPAPKF